MFATVRPLLHENFSDSATEQNKQANIGFNGPLSSCPATPKTHEEQLQCNKPSIIPPTECISAKSLFSFPGYDLLQLKATGWPLPTEEEVESVRTSGSDFTSKTMDILGKVLQDYCLQSGWRALGPSDKGGPPLFLSSRDLQCLRDDFNDMD